jgi:hypothetical protein
MNVGWFIQQWSGHSVRGLAHAACVCVFLIPVIATLKRRRQAAEACASPEIAAKAYVAMIAQV